MRPEPRAIQPEEQDAEVDGKEKEESAVDGNNFVDPGCLLGKLHRLRNGAETYVSICLCCDYFSYNDEDCKYSETWAARLCSNCQSLSDDSVYRANRVPFEQGVVVCHGCTLTVPTFATSMKSCPLCRLDRVRYDAGNVL